MEQVTFEAALSQAALLMARVYRSNRVKGWSNAAITVYPLTLDGRFGCLLTHMANNKTLLIGCNRYTCASAIVADFRRELPQIQHVRMHDSNLYLPRMNPEINYEVRIQVNTPTVALFAQVVRLLGNGYPLEPTIALVDDAIARIKPYQYEPLLAA